MILAEQPISHVDVIRSGTIVESISVSDDKILFRLEREIEPLEDGEYLYIRIVQIDGGAAWSSPFFGPTQDQESAGTQP